MSRRVMAAWRAVAFVASAASVRVVLEQAGLWVFVGVGQGASCFGDAVCIVACCAFVALAEWLASAAVAAVAGLRNVVGVSQILWSMLVSLGMVMVALALVLG